MAVGDTYQLSIRGTYLGQAYIHTLHFRQTNTDLDPNVESGLIGDWNTFARTDWLAIHPPDYQLVDAEAKRVCGTLPLPAPVVLTEGFAGTRSPGTNQLLAPWLTMVTVERTGLAGRSRRGRYFASGAHEGDVTGAAFVTGPGSFHNAVIAYNSVLSARYFGSSGMRLVVHSPTLLGAPGGTCTGARTDVTQLFASTLLGTNKSRKA